MLLWLIIVPWLVWSLTASVAVSGFKFPGGLTWIDKFTTVRRSCDNVMPQLSISDFSPWSSRLRYVTMQCSSSHHNSRPLCLVLCEWLPETMLLRLPPWLCFFTAYRDTCSTPLSFRVANWLPIISFFRLSEFKYRAFYVQSDKVIQVRLVVKTGCAVFRPRYSAYLFYASTAPHFDRVFLLANTGFNVNGFRCVTKKYNKYVCMSLTFIWWLMPPFLHYLLYLFHRHRLRHLGSWNDFLFLSSVLQ